MPNLELKQIYKELMIKTATEVSNFPWENPNAYANWLSQSYYFVRHSSRLLSLAAGKSDLTQESLHLRMVSHLREEQGHEKLALSDLKAMGFSIDASEEFLSTKLFYQSQYYWILYKAPAAFFGYIIYLEGLAAEHGPHILKRVAKAYGDRSTRFLKVHAEEDQAHIKQAFEQLEALSNEEISLVAENLVNSSQLYLSMLSSCSEIKTRNEVKLLSAQTIS